MSYQVLARKWRPRRFEDLVGQEHVIRPLVNALDHNRLHHAFLFTGTRGVGKTTIARILAKSLNCEAGVSSTPCGTCSACTEVDEGRFVDLIEVDAASRTKVDDTRELLDNVQYAPTRGRYKVYLIDEVHMLSGHSFNALLKTLEEPPPHVKFLLATTDPQKLPVTVLSRCLQFNLKRLTPEQIVDQLQKIVEAEGVAHDMASLQMLARAADGSLRDALSLLDQALAYGGGKINETEVRHMLGTIDQNTVNQLLRALVEGSARDLMETVAQAAEHSVDYDALLDELLRRLHRIALAQVDSALAGEDEADAILAYSQRLTSEDTQLYYQIGLIGRRDLRLAPEPRSGLEMTLLRMLAFRPTEAGVTISTTSSNKAKVVAPAKPETAAVNDKIRSDTNHWSEIVGQLDLSGLARELATNLSIEGSDAVSMALLLDESHAQLLSKERQMALQQALEKFYGRAVRLSIRIGCQQEETPAKEKQRKLDESQQAAAQAIDNDPNVRALREQFNARVTPGSIRPTKV